jgi:acylphosphatase
MIRLTAYVSGRVQRVGYRAKVVSLANEIDTTWFDHKFQRASACGRDKKTCKRLGRWLIKKLRLLTTEAQSSLRRSEFLSIQPKKAHPIASGIVVSVRSSSVRSATLWFTPVNRQG